MKNFLLTIITIFVATAYSVNLSADVATSMSLSINIAQDSTAQIDMSVNLVNSTSLSIIPNYSIKFPFSITEGSAFIDSNKVDLTLEKSSVETGVKVNLGSNFVKPNESKTLKISLKSNAIFKEMFNTKRLQLYAPTSNIKYQFVDLNIVYPSTLGDFVFYGQSDYKVETIDTNFTKISLNQTKPLFIAFGEPQLSILLDTTISNKTEQVNSFLLPLVPALNGQSVSYIDISKGEYALIDKYSNEFALINLQPNSTSKIFLNSNLKITKSNLNDFPNLKYDWQLIENSQLGQKIINIINPEDSLENKFSKVNEYLFNEYQIDMVRNTMNDINSIWYREDKRISMLQYCNVMTSLANRLNIKSKIEYGYPLIEAVSESVIEPSILCSFLIDGSIIKFDFSLQKRMGYSFLSKSNLDYIIFGVWENNQGYNTLLGLLIDSPISAKISSYKNNLESSDLIDLKLDFPRKAYSGEFYSGSLIIKSSKNKTLRLDSLRINGVEIKKYLEVGDLTKSVMPLGETIIKLDYLRENDFILNQSKDVFVEIDLDKKDLQAQTNIRFEPDFRLLLVFLAIFFGVTSLFVYLVMRLFFKKKYKY